MSLQKFLVKRNKWGNMTNGDLVFVKIDEKRDFVCVGVQDNGAKVPTTIMGSLSTVIPFDKNSIKLAIEACVTILDRSLVEKIQNVDIKKHLERLVFYEPPSSEEEEEEEDFEETIKALRAQIETLKDEKHQLASAYHRVSCLSEKHEAAVATWTTKYETEAKERLEERRESNGMIDNERDVHEFKTKRMMKDYSAIVEDLGKSQTELEKVKKELATVSALAAAKDKVLSDTLAEVHSEREETGKLREILNNSTILGRSGLSPEEVEFFGLVG